jgi:hypothetical protein
MRSHQEKIKLLALGDEEYFRRFGSWCCENSTNFVAKRQSTDDLLLTISSVGYDLVLWETNRLVASDSHRQIAPISSPVAVMVVP